MDPMVLRVGFRCQTVFKARHQKNADIDTPGTLFSDKKILIKIHKKNQMLAIIQTGR